MIYILILALLIVLSLKFDYFDHFRGRQFWFFTVLIIFILVAGLRYKVGGDTFTYMHLYLKIPPINELRYSDFITLGKEPFWIVLNSISKYFSNDFYIVQILVATFVNSVLFIFLKKNTKYYFTAILFYYILFFHYFNMEILRESIAISIFLLSLESLHKREFSRYYLLMFIAFFFHYGSVVMILIPFLVSDRFKVRYIFWILLLVASIKIGGLLFLLDFIPLNEVMETKFLEYASLDSLNINGIIAQAIKFVILPIFFYLVLLKVGRYQHILEKLSSAYLFFAMLAVFFTGLYRYINYFVPLMLIYISYVSVVFFRSKGLMKKIILFGLLFVILSFRILSLTNVVGHQVYYYKYYPYYSIFDEREDPKRQQFMIEIGKQT